MEHISEADYDLDIVFQEQEDRAMNSEEEDNNDRIVISYYAMDEEGVHGGAGEGSESSGSPEPAPERAEADAQSADEEHFDITLAASHSYMGSELQSVRGRIMLEAGWRGVVPCLVHGGCVFPGETVPLLLLDHGDAHILNTTMEQDRLFALLCPDESSLSLSGYGVLCEVFEATSTAPARCLARALHRCRLVSRVAPQPNNNMRQLEVMVLPEVTLPDPLRPSRLACLDSHRHANTLADRGLRALDALVTPWPLFVFDIFDFRRMRDTIKEYFKTLGLENMLPSEPVSLSFWVARNMTLGARDRLALFTVDNALLRLHMECSFISRKSVVCCAGCLAQLARREHVFAMSSDGVHSTYANPGGHMHDIVTVTRARNAQPSGGACSDFSWFPGYSWTILMCSRCMAHVGWRFDALRSNLRPARFYGLSRNYVQPHEATPLDPNEPLHIPLLQVRLT